MRFPDRVPNRYLVILNDTILPDNVPDIAQSLAREHDGRVRGVMNAALNIFSTEMSDAQAERLARHPLVSHVEEVTDGHLSAIQNLPQPPYNNTGTDLNELDLWGLDRLDQWGTGSLYNYQYCERASDVIVYVVDTGVSRNHQEFDGNCGTSRVRTGVSCDGSTCTSNPGGDMICPGNTNPFRSTNLKLSHGTAVASIIGGRTIGVAKEVEIVPVKISYLQRQLHE